MVEGVFVGAAEAGVFAPVMLEGALFEKGAVGFGLFVVGLGFFQEDEDFGVGPAAAETPGGVGHLLNAKGFGVVLGLVAGGECG